ncbi:MAG TPA: uroporphyrinogen decarboxylase family protein [bacterium]|nr:uroporphyrinogen decarboxylase family protein [bacterium]
MNEKVGSKGYWRDNNIALALTTMGMLPKRPAAFFTLDGDWICEFLDVSFKEYYTDCDFQIECKKKAGEAIREALGMSMPTYVDFGTVMDVSIFGAELTFMENAAPSNEPVIDSPAEIPALVEKMDGTTDLMGLGLIPSFFEWRDKYKEAFGKMPIAGLSIKGPATMAGQICGMTQVMMYLMTNPAEMTQLIKCIGRTMIRYVRQIRRKCNAPGVSLAMANDLAGLISPDMYVQFFQPVEKRIFQALCPIKKLRYYHADSRMNHQIANLKAHSLGMVNFGPSLEIEEIVEKIPGPIIFGHVPPVEILGNGTPQQVLECGIKNYRDAYRLKNRIVLSSAGSVNPGTSFENLKALLQAPVEFAKLNS